MLFTLNLGILFCLACASRRRLGVRRRELAVEGMSTVSQNGYELVQKWLRVRRQAR